MELALLDDDERATLAAALALVDGEQVNSYNNNNSNGAWPQLLPSHEVCAARACKQQNHAGRSAPDLRAQQGSTRDRKRQRKEIERLRDEAVDLEAYVEQLQKRFIGKSGTGGAQGCGSQCSQEREEGTAGSTVTNWFLTAVAEYKKLERAKQRNQDLKAALEEEREVSSALIKIFQQQLSKEVSGFVWLCSLYHKSLTHRTLSATLRLWSI